MHGNRLAIMSARRPSMASKTNSKCCIYVQILMHRTPCVIAEQRHCSFPPQRLSAYSIQTIQPARTSSQRCPCLPLIASASAFIVIVLRPFVPSAPQGTPTKMAGPGELEASKIDLSHQEMDRLVTELEQIWAAFTVNEEGPSGIEWLPVNGIAQALQEVSRTSIGAGAGAADRGSGYIHTLSVCADIGLAAKR